MFVACASRAHTHHHHHHVLATAKSHVVASEHMVASLQFRHAYCQLMHMCSDCVCVYEWWTRLLAICWYDMWTHFPAEVLEEGTDARLSGRLSAAWPWDNGTKGFQQIKHLTKYTQTYIHTPPQNTHQQFVQRQIIYLCTHQRSTLPLFIWRICIWLAECGRVSSPRHHI